jgi:hypothetical protein
MAAYITDDLGNVFKPSHPAVGTGYYDPHQQTQQVWDGSGWKLVIPDPVKRSYFDQNFIELGKIIYPWGKPESGSDLEEMIFNQIQLFLVEVDDMLTDLPSSSLPGDIESLINQLLINLKFQIERELRIPLELQVAVFKEPVTMSTSINFAVKLSPYDVTTYEGRMYEQILKETFEDTSSNKLDPDSPEVTELLRKSAKSIGW